MSLAGGPRRALDKLRGFKGWAHGLGFHNLGGSLRTWCEAAKKKRKENNSNFFGKHIFPSSG